MQTKGSASWGVLTMALFIATPGCSLFGALLLVLYFTENTGNGYVKIAKELGISENTVKSYCRRQNVADKQGESACCAECGKPIDISKRSGRRFCSDTCRMKWWNRYPKPNMPYTAQCACCGKEISMRRRGEKKYCSHRCYILDRYKDGGSNG